MGTKGERMNELKCPKCGETEKIYNTFDLYKKGYGIKCGNCGYEIKNYKSYKEAKFKWESENNPKALRPCPFCGADDVNLSVREDEDGEPYIYCHVCYSVYYGDPSQNIIEMWNRRMSE